MEEETAPKKQFRLKKKTFFIFLGVFVVFASVVAGVTYFLLKEGQERLDLESEYNRFLEYCEEGDGGTLECKVLLGDFYETEDRRKDCVEVLLPVADAEQREVSFCFKRGIVEWENPYNDYSRYIPVLIVIEGYEELSRVNSVKMVVLEDEEGYRVASEVYEEGGFPFIIWTREERIALERGYDVIGEVDDAEAFIPVGISIRKARVLSYVLEGDAISLEVQTYVMGENVTFFLNSNDFFLSGSSLKEDLLISSNNIDEFNTELEYRVIFLLEDSSSFSVEYVEEQLSLLVDGEDSEFLLEKFGIIDEEE